MNQLVKVEEVTKVYTTLLGRNPYQALKGVSLGIDRGSIYGLLGPNGAGKTTLIKIICGLVIPTSGSVSVNGFNLETDPLLARYSLGAVLEGNRNIHWRLSPLENLFYFGQLHNQSLKDIKERSERVLCELALWDKRHEQVNKLSRGMQQKVSIAVALVSNPEVLLLDEPTLGLDVEISIQIKQYLKDLAKSGKSILLTTHQMDLAEAVCDKIGIIKNGQIIREITKEWLTESRDDNNFSLEKFFLETISDNNPEGGA